MGFFGSIAKLAGGLIKGGPIGLVGAAVGLATAKKNTAAATYYPPPPPPPVEAPAPYILPNYSYQGSGAGGGPVNTYDPPSKPMLAAPPGKKAAKRAKKAAKKTAKKAKKAAKKKSAAYRKKYGKKKKG